MTTGRGASEAVASADTSKGCFIDLVFDGPPGPQGGRFIEAEDCDGRIMMNGQWKRRDDGRWVLRLHLERAAAEEGK